MTPTLTDLLDKARAYGGPSTMAPGVSDAEAHVAAWHAIAIQGGYTSPEREAWRLAADYGHVPRIVADAETKGLANESQVNVDLMVAALGTELLGRVIAEAVRSLRDSPAQPAGTFLPLEQRQEFTDPTGKLFHNTGVGDDMRQHVGSWLTCDACNPVQVVKADHKSGVFDQQELALLRAEYDTAKAAKDKAEEEFKTIQAKLRTSLSEATRGALRSALHVPGYRPITLTYGERWTVDSKRLKAEQPVTYAAYAKLGSNWTLQESKGQQP
jgi:hypothetical protein